MIKTRSHVHLKDQDNMKPIQIVIADDHPIYRNGIAALLNRMEDYDLVGEAANGVELLEVVKDRQPDVVITDIRMPEMDGIEVTRNILQHYPDIRILALSMHEEEKLISEMLKAGAMGYLLKNTEKMELIEAITAVMKGDMFFNHSISGNLLAKFINQDSAKPSLRSREKEDKDLLTDREKEILKLIVEEEMTNERIARKLSISKRTVDTHRKNLLLKLGVNNTVGLVKLAYKLGLVDA